MTTLTTIISDVHGSHNTLLRLLDRCPRPSNLILLGDLIDRGPSSRVVVESLVESVGVIAGLGRSLVVHTEIVLDGFVSFFFGGKQTKIDLAQAPDEPAPFAFGPLPRDVAVFRSLGALPLSHVVRGVRQQGLSFGVLTQEAQLSDVVASVDVAKEGADGRLLPYEGCRRTMTPSLSVILGCVNGITMPQLRKQVIDESPVLVDGRPERDLSLAPSRVEASVPIEIPPPPVMTKVRGDLVKQGTGRLLGIKAPRGQRRTSISHHQPHGKLESPPRFAVTHRLSGFPMHQTVRGTDTLDGVGVVVNTGDSNTAPRTRKDEMGIRPKQPEQINGALVGQIGQHCKWGRRKT